MDYVRGGFGGYYPLGFSAMGGTDMIKEKLYISSLIFSGFIATITGALFCAKNLETFLEYLK